MGRKNLESFGKLLPNRTNIILTRDRDFTYEGAVIFHELDSAIEFARKRGEEELMIIGGGEIYKQALPLADRIYLTRIHTTLEGDTYFPEFDEGKWKVTMEKYHPKDERHQFDFTFLTFERQ